jgi:streptomycin 6-kinase
VHRLLTPSLLDRGESIFREMVASQGRLYLLHGDLHHDNILSDTRHGWVVIDPKGVIGESAFETAASIRNPMDFFPFQADPMFMSRRVDIFAERLSMDRKRILSWFATQQVLSTCWQVEDGEPEEAVARGVYLAEAGLALLNKA